MLTMYPCTPSPDKTNRLLARTGGQRRMDGLVFAKAPLRGIMLRTANSVPSSATSPIAGEADPNNGARACPTSSVLARRSQPCLPRGVYQHPDHS